MDYESKSNKWLKDELWRIFSLYTRQRYANDNGKVRCITCGAWRPWRRLQAGHYISRKHNSTFIDEYNVFPQCGKCNGDGYGMPEEYAAFLDMYFPGERERVEAKSREIFKMDREWMIEQINHYNFLLKERGFVMR